MTNSYFLTQLDERNRLVRTKASPPLPGFAKDAKSAAQRASTSLTHENPTKTLQNPTKTLQNPKKNVANHCLYFLSYCGYRQRRIAQQYVHGGAFRTQQLGYGNHVHYRQAAVYSKADDRFCIGGGQCLVFKWLVLNYV
uniref:Uncharacterized protein n=1 Tax=Globodera pallida TaxID=36090 RepID=A0A183BRT2_GLOPA